MEHRKFLKVSHVYISQVAQTVLTAIAVDTYCVNCFRPACLRVNDDLTTTNN